MTEEELDDVVKHPYEVLFNKVGALSGELRLLAGVVQNDAPVTAEDLELWLCQAEEFEAKWKKTKGAIIAEVDKRTTWPMC